MSGKNDMIHSVLIVSGSDQFVEATKKALPSRGLLSVEVHKSGVLGRRSVLERYYDLVIVNVPLPDETGIELVMDLTEICSASVLMATPQEVYEDAWEHVADHGVLVVSKPFTQVRMNQAIRYCMAAQERVRSLERSLQREQEKTEELRIVNKAKFFLVEHKHMTEDEAHRFIGKQAMDHGMSRRRTAEQILEGFLVP